MFKIIKGFTMAEVLITLGILGVVIAMTLPGLMGKYNNKIAETRLQKFYSIFNQAILQSIVKNGPPESWSYWNNDIKDEEGNPINRQEDNKKSFDLYLAPFFNISSVQEIEISGEKYYLYYLADGSAFSFARHENRDISFYPKNAEKCLKKSKAQEPTGGVCSFIFSFYPLNKTTEWQHAYKKGLEPFMYRWNGSMEQLYNDATYGCAKADNGGYCTAIIQQNGWKVPKDYPKRIAY